LNLTYENGTLQKEGGTALYSSGAIVTTGTSILAGADWFPAEAVQRQIIVAGTGRVLRDTGAGTFPTVMVSGLSFTNTVPVFVNGGAEVAANPRKLFLFSENNAVHTVSGDSTGMVAFASGPADWTGSSQPSFGLIHENRMWGGGNSNDPHRLYFSTPSDHAIWASGTTDGSLSVYPGEGERLMGAISFKGLIIAWKKPRGMYVIDTSNTTIANWRVVRLTRAIGGSSPFSAVMVDDDVLFMDSAFNFHLLSGITEFGDMGSRNLSQQAEMEPFFRDNFNLARLDQVRSVYYSAKRQAHFAAASIGATVNNHRVVIDFNRLELARFGISDKNTCESLWLRQDGDNIERPICGNDTGDVLLLDQESRSNLGVGYVGEFQTPHTDLSFLDPALASKRKMGDFLELVVEPQGNWNLSVDVLWDDEITQTIQFNMGEEGSTLGSFVLDTDLLAGDRVVNRKRRITGSGRRISLRGRNSGDGQDFSVAKFILHFRVGDERL